MQDLRSHEGPEREMVEIEKMLRNDRSGRGGEYVGNGGDGLIYSAFMP